MKSVSKIHQTLLALKNEKSLVEKKLGRSRKIGEYSLLHEELMDVEAKIVEVSKEIEWAKHLRNKKRTV